MHCEQTESIQRKSECKHCVNDCWRKNLSYAMDFNLSRDSATLFSMSRFRYVPIKRSNNRLTMMKYAKPFLYLSFFNLFVGVSGRCAQHWTGTNIDLTLSHVRAWLCSWHGFFFARVCCHAKMRKVSWKEQTSSSAIVDL